MDTPVSTDTQTPHTSVYGALLITAGLLLALVAYGEKMPELGTAGAVVTFAGIVFAVIGNRQKKNLARQAAAQPANRQK